MALPDHPERIRVCGPRRFFQPGYVGRCPIRVRGGPVELATVVKVEAPLNGRVLWKGLPRVLRPRACSGSPYRINKKGQHQAPALVPEAPIGYIKKESTNKKGTAPKSRRVAPRTHSIAWVSRLHRIYAPRLSRRVFPIKLTHYSIERFQLNHFLFGISTAN